MTMKYILVTGGVISGIGKGVIASSIGVLLKSFALRVTSIKIDPYINIDAGTFSPYEHGEVYVLDDGGEVDLDLGNYERFLNITLTKDNNITTGKVYKEVIDKERRGDYLGKTVQIIPHITDAIQDWVERVARIPVDTRNRTDSAATDDQKVPQVCVIELGGTIGDIEGMPFVEAFRQFARRAGKDNFCNVHVSLVPQPKTTGEHKTKPTQVSVRELRALGLSPDLIICRSETPINDEVQKKISNFCHVEPKEVVCIHDRSSIYRVPLALHEQNLAHFFANKLALSLPLHPTTNLLDQFEHLADLCDNLHREVTIALVGKYTKLQDSYASVIKSLQHSALSIDHKLNLMYIEAEALEESYKQIDEVKHYEAWQSLCKSNGVLVPGGFGDRGIEGKIRAIEWARVNKKPFLGICLGLQCAVIEFARNVLKWPNANSTEVDPNCETAVVIDMPEHHQGDLGGTMRLGKRTTKFRTGVKSRLRQLYGNVETVDERHRHRYEVNNKLVDEFEKFGMHFVGHDETGERMEIMELEDHPYFVGVQYHPEYLSRPVKPSPPFKGLVLAASGKLECHLKGEFSKGRPSPRLFSDESSANASDSDSDFSLINRA